MNSYGPRPAQPESAGHLVDTALRWLKWGGVVGIVVVYLRYAHIYFNPYTSSPGDDPWFYINNNFFFGEHWVSPECLLLSRGLFRSLKGGAQQTETQLAVVRGSVGRLSPRPLVLGLGWSTHLLRVDDLGAVVTPRPTRLAPINRSRAEPPIFETERDRHLGALNDRRSPSRFYPPGLTVDGSIQSSYLKDRLSRTRKALIRPSSIVTSCLTTSASRRSRKELAAVSTAVRAASSQDSWLVPMTSVTRYTLMASSSEFRSHATNGGSTKEPA
jgi:hypothetical protein